MLLSIFPVASLCLIPLTNIILWNTLALVPLETVRRDPRVSSIFPVFTLIRSKVEVTSHHEHLFSEATVIAPHANSSHLGRSARKKTFDGALLSDDSHCNCAAVGIFAKTSPFLENPDGGQALPKQTTACTGGSFFFFFFTTFFFFTAGFLVAGFFVSVAVVFALGFGVAVGEAAIAEVVERVRIEIKNTATNFFNPCSI